MRELINTDNKINKELQNEIRKANSLQKVVILLSSAYTQKKVAQIIINEGFQILGADIGDISLVYPDRSFSILARKGYPKKFVDKFKKFPANTPLLTHKVIHSKKPYFIKDIADLPKKYLLAHSFLKSTNTKSAAILPLKIKSRIIGILQFNFKDPQEFNSKEKMFMNLLAAQCAQALERVIAQENLHASKDQLEVILKNTADGILVQNIDGHITFINNAGFQLFNLSKNKSQIKKLTDLSKYFEILDENENQIQLNTLSQALQESKNKSLVHTHCFKRKDNEELIWLTVKSAGIFDNKGNILMIIHTFHDITKAKEVDQRKDEFISIASHELKTPLTSMKLFLSLFTKQAQKKLDVKSTHYLQKVIDQVDRLHVLISDLFDISQIQKGKLQYNKEKFRLDTLIASTIEELQLNVTTHKIEFFNRSDVIVFADKYRIYQVISNLISNAIKYSPNESRIIIKLEKKRNEVTFSVRDFGIGISKSDQKKIFDRFYQTSEAQVRSQTGLGMGLYISNEIIKFHKGRIWVESEKGKGSTFKFNLPIKVS